MKKLVAGLLTICLVFPVAVGCSSGDTSPVEPETFAPLPSGASDDAGGGGAASTPKAKDKVGAAADPVE